MTQFREITDHFSFPLLTINWVPIISEIDIKIIQNDSPKILDLLKLIETCYSRVRNKRSPTIIIFLTFFQGLRPYSGLHSIR